MACHCGLDNDYRNCCGLYHRGKVPLTPESLMRSRYSAFVLGNCDYILKTMRGSAARDFDLQETQQWMQRTTWLGLTVLDARTSTTGDRGTVEFVARYKEGLEEHVMHECSVFQRHKGVWYYTGSRATRCAL